MEATGRVRLIAGAALLALGLMTGCRNADDQAIDQAKSQATTTNTPQQVQWVDGNGNTVTKVVTPPVQKGQSPQISTQITPPPPGTKPKSTPPVITPLAPGQVPDTQYAANTASSEPAPANEAGAPAPAAQPAPGQPASAPAPVRLTIPAGTELAIRINQSISVKSSHAGDHFTGEFADPVVRHGEVVIPRGTPVRGRVDAAHRRGHFKGASVLELRLTSMVLNGNEYALDTHDNVHSKKGKGKRTAGWIGGLGGAGALIGGLAGGGVGLAVGAASGAGAGTVIAGATGNRDINIPAESIQHFRLSDDLVLQNP